jgi:predicted AlkP superfamily pyrophosphatase or phosphodiesterase
MMKICILAFLILFQVAENAVQAQSGRKTEKLVMVALDGMRWQEIFGGVDSSLMNDPLYTKERNDMQKVYWDADARERRKKLFPFLWSTIATQGQLYGNRDIGNRVNVANPYHFTYPGFSETLTGNPDSAVNSNKLIANKNANVLEFINRQPGYAGKVVAFTTSDLFPYLLNKWRNGLIVNSNNDSLPYPAPGFQLLNDMETLSAKPTGERPDLLTYFAGREYLKTYRPKVLYIALGETDAFAHDGSYDQYIGAAHAEDGVIADLWKLLQSLPEYKDKTTMILTCDHGRGSHVKKDWTDHGVDIPESGEIWIAVICPDASPRGEVGAKMQLWQGQLAATMAALLGMSYRPPGQPVLPVAETILH